MRHNFRLRDATISVCGESRKSPSSTPSCNQSGQCSGFQNVWPTTTAIGGPATNNLDSAIAKIDYNLNTNNQISGRYFFGNSHQSFPLGIGGGNNLPNTNTNAPIRTQLVSLSWVKTVSPEKVNEARFGWNRYRNGFFPQDASIFGDPNDSLGINTLNLLGPNTALPRDFGLPTIDVSGFAHLGSSAFSNPRNRVDMQLSIFRQLFVEDRKARHKVRRRVPPHDCGFVQRSRWARDVLDFNGLTEFLGRRLERRRREFREILLVTPTRTSQRSTFKMDST